MMPYFVFLVPSVNFVSAVNVGGTNTDPCAATVQSVNFVSAVNVGGTNTDACTATVQSVKLEDTAAGFLNQAVKGKYLQGINSFT